MTNAVLSPSPVQKFFDNNGVPLSYGTVATYSAGTVTPIATYTDSSASTPNPNPITLNFRGETPIWLLPNVGYKYVVSDQYGNIIPGGTTDQIYGSPTITLYGGVDTGAVNAYILNFVANYSSLTNGLIVYWIPANTNTGPSTLNVNGLGVIPILNQNGTTLGTGQIVASGVTAVFYYNGNWLLTSSTGSVTQSGSFTGVLTSGVNTAPGSCRYSITGNVCTLFIPYLSVSISAGFLSMTGLPIVCTPPTTAAVTRICIASNNGSAIDTCILQIFSDSTMNFYVSAADFETTGWVTAATIGLKPAPVFQYGNTITYALF